ncbi:MAG TPA: hypothetical protein VD793_05385 [Gemmatimonadales bacterium]|nr:hypothetical protein [Gemmatimonadales bacterium]
MGAVAGIAIGLAAGLALLVYLRHEAQGVAGAGLAALRTVAMAVLILLLWDPIRSVRVPAGRPTVLLDASLSMAAAGGRWAEARDTALALVRGGGTVLRFGRTAEPFDTLPPDDGATRLATALPAARGRGGPLVVVTDGELEDRAAVDPRLLEGARILVLPRSAGTNAAVVEVTAPERATAQDTIRVAVGVEFTTDVGSDSALVEVREGTRRLARASIPVTRGGFVRRTITLAPGSLSPGEHVVRVGVSLAGDTEPRDNERLQVIAVAGQASVVVLAAPGDWEARFFATALAEIVRTPVEAYALIRPAQWVNMHTLAPVADAEVVRRTAAAHLVALFGSRPPQPAGTPALWQWRGADSLIPVLPGDWYVMRHPPASPLGGRLAGVSWDSVPPLTAVAPAVPGVGEWTALSARLGRRGADRPVLVGRDSAGVRQLVTTGEGLWRWALRGGAHREAYRTLVAAGVDWLLGSDAGIRAGPVGFTPVVPRGTPVTFQWRSGVPPDSLVVQLTGTTSRRAVLRFDAAGRADLLLPPGVYRWSLPEAGRSIEGTGGLLAVEEYSDEFRPRAVTLAPAAGSDGLASVFRRTRDRWWLFGLVLACLVAEWAWRLRRGLP